MRGGKVSIPRIDPLVDRHYDHACSALDAMSPSRRHGAASSIRAWRRVLRAFAPEGQYGLAFRGDELMCYAELKLHIGQIIVGLDDSYSRARWYAGRYVAPRALRAFLLWVGPAGFETLIEVDQSPWAPKLLGFLATRPEICRTAGVVTIGAEAPSRSPSVRLGTLSFNGDSGS